MHSVMSVEWIIKTMNISNNPPMSLDNIQNDSINQINTLNLQQDTRLTAVETVNTQQSTAITALQSDMQAINAQLETIDDDSIDSLLT